MPGPVSDAFDPEWGTRARAQNILDTLESVYARLSHILEDQPPKYILDLVDEDLPTRIVATLSEKEWRLLRFSVERAMESL